MFHSEIVGTELTLQREEEQYFLNAKTAAEANYGSNHLDDVDARVIFFHILLHTLLFIQYFVTFLPKTVTRDLAREYAFYPLS